MSPNLANPNIKHVFVLMLENRSFDHMLGFSGLTGTDPATGGPTTINGVSTADSNSYLGVPYPATPDADYIMPFDPGHEFPDVVQQLCGPEVNYTGGAYPPLNNSGFVSDYATTRSAGEGGATSNFGEIMKCYDPTAQLPIMTALAQQFAVCDNWFASLPGPTWPNRFFVHAASSGGLDHSPRTIETTEWETIKGFSFPHGTIFQSMDRNARKWRLYRGVSSPLIGSLPCVAGLKGIQLWDTHSYGNFASDLGGNYPYAYTFIEPNYGDIVNSSFAGGQSQHPMDDVRNGEALIKSTYEVIRNSPLWLNSLLIITYDEHGGFYDHVPPPVAIAPGDTVPRSKYNQYGFPFQQYGVRVPALVISAYTAKSWISHACYDHSSVPATLEAMLNLPALTQRDAVANNVTVLASLPVARTDTPTHLPDLPVIAPEAVAAARAIQPVQDETVTPVDGGNLPGFLHIAMKAELDRAALQGEQDRAVLQANKNLLMDRFTGTIRTKADARTFLETRLPDLLTPPPAPGPPPLPPAP